MIWDDLDDLMRIPVNGSIRVDFCATGVEQRSSRSSNPKPRFKATMAGRASQGGPDSPLFGFFRGRFFRFQRPDQAAKSMTR